MSKVFFIDRNLFAIIKQCNDLAIGFGWLLKLFKRNNQYF